jgi:acyl-coenzyme A thioesterase PaaI-like protein
LTEAAKPTAYPPSHHIVRDLRIAIDRSSGEWLIRIPIGPEILDASGRPRVGILAVIADMIAGQTAIREVAPSWIATSNLSLSVGELPSEGMLVGRPKILRKGATTIVIEVELEHLLEQKESGRSVGITTLGFAILPRRNELQAELHRSRTENTEGSDTIYAPPPGAGLTKPLLEAMAVAFDPLDPGTAQIAVDPYLQNTLGALQGGIVAIFAEATAERFAASVLGAPVRVRGLELQYLKLGKVGPIRARAREIGRTASGLIVRVELDDRGQGEALLTVATVWIDRLAPTSK